MRTELRLPSCDGRSQLYTVLYTPDATAPRAVLQLVHGMVEYIDRYQPFAEWLCAQGWAVIGHDHLGHGHTSAEADWGYIREKEPAAALCEDMHTVRAWAEKRFPGLKVFMLGHSMGSYLLRMYLSDHSDGLAGAIVMGTGFMPEATTTAGLGLVRLLTAFHGGHGRRRIVDSMVFGKDYKRYDITGADPTNSWLTKDVDIVRKYYADPFCTFTFTLNGYEALLTAVQNACSQTQAEKIRSDLPVLLISGADDPVGAFGEGVRQTEAQLKKAGLTDVTLRLIDGDRHEVLNETDRAAVADELAEWLERVNAG